MKVFIEIERGREREKKNKPRTNNHEKKWVYRYGKQLKMTVTESDSIFRLGKFCSPDLPATTMPVVFIPLNYIDISKGIGS